MKIKEGSHQSISFSCHIKDRLLMHMLIIWWVVSVGLFVWENSMKKESGYMSLIFRFPRNWSLNWWQVLSFFFPKWISSENDPKKAHTHTYFIRNRTISIMKLFISTYTKYNRMFFFMSPVWFSLLELIWKVIPLAFIFFLSFLFLHFSKMIS